jgi:hypothetical protein
MREFVAGLDLTEARPPVVTGMHEMAAIPSFWSAPWRFCASLALPTSSMQTRWAY